MGSDQHHIHTNYSTYDFLDISPNPDGTITRHTSIPDIPASLNPAAQLNSALSKDLPLQPHLSTWIRLYLPHPSSFHKLPLILYFHGGGFVILSAATSLNHHFCSLLSTGLNAVVASLDYRLAPEHRLPAAYDDAMECLRWLDSTDEEWIREHTDLSCCYLMGSSAGGNMAYHVGLQACAGEGNDLMRLRIKGLILHHPFFGGSKRTASELRLSEAGTLPMSVVDLMWELALPVGVGFDHEYCNPMSGEGEGLGRMRGKGLRVMVTGGEEDPLIDRQRELAEKLRESGVEVVACFGKGDFHGVELCDSAKAKDLINNIKSFFMSN